MIGSSNPQTLTISGSAFSPSSTVTLRSPFQTYVNLPTTSITATQISMQVTIWTTAAQWTVEVIDHGVSSGQFAFQVVAPLANPVISSVSPNPVTGSNSSQTFTINGSGFTANSSVTLRSPFQTYPNQPTSSITATQIVIPVTFGTTAAQWTVEVIDHGVSSGQFAFQVVAPLPSPAISSVSPNPVTGSNSAQIFTINGSGFTANSAVTLRSPFQTYPNQPTSSITSSQIVIPVTFGTTAAQWTVEVIDHGVSSGQFAFQVVAPPAPHINSVSPNPVTGSNSLQTFTVNASYFLSHSTFTLLIPFQTYPNNPPN